METGQQTQLSPKINKVADSIQGDGVLYLIRVLQFLQALHHQPTPEPDFSRTAETILESKVSTGCHDYGVACVAFLRAKDIETTYIQALNIDDVKNFGKPEGRFRGHVFCRAHVEGVSLLVDPQNGVIFLKSEIRGMVVAGEGLDSWDIGLKKGLEDLKKLFKKRQRALGDKAHEEQ